MTAADRFRAAVDSRDLAGLEELFTEDIRLYSPVKFTPFEGRSAVLGLFTALFQVFEDFRYIGEYSGTSLTSADNTEAASAVLLFRATAGGRQIHGIDLLHLTADDRIKEFTVMVRPQSAVQALGEAVLTVLTARATLTARAPLTARAAEDPAP
ncbi:nuclear transport factor 2 family protein [Streptomyces alkaliterrae]|uniref:Nuclear transport factor 2 family protein n=1 Tax=Streptomyces alkaliterrae TaxID=2213162 RepID=A0A5P0YXG7_9ACTN|nr:nuclear transport factor 2 family protein [Streptomyces alkaliterrae]MBB1259246.1 nuclear transport factor 2 family protein [Streptomyces alkaliterrae]MQS04202.1 nuclear transport factor 2 family protein [Streptomyces alkaliterrae]